MTDFSKWFEDMLQAGYVHKGEAAKSDPKCKVEFRLGLGHCDNFLTISDEESEEGMGCFVYLFHLLLEKGADPDNLCLYISPKMREQLFPFHSGIIVEDHRIPIREDPQVITTEMEDGGLSSDIWMGMIR